MTIMEILKKTLVYLRRNSGYNHPFTELGLSCDA
jgi:hypothetical protein